MPAEQVASQDGGVTFSELLDLAHGSEALARYYERRIRSIQNGEAPSERFIPTEELEDAAGEKASGTQRS